MIEWSAPNRPRNGSRLAADDVDARAGCRGGSEADDHFRFTKAGDAIGAAFELGTVDIDLEVVAALDHALFREVILKDVVGRAAVGDIGDLLAIRNDVFLVEQVKGEQRDIEQDRDRDPGPQHLDKRVVREFLRHRVGLAVVAYDHPDQQRQHEQADDGDDRQQHPVVELVHFLGQRRVRGLETQLAVLGHLGHCESEG